MGDYLTTRCRERDLSFQALSEAIGATHAYIHSITTGQFGSRPGSRRLRLMKTKTSPQ
jgi:hypothetical protein